MASGTCDRNVLVLGVSGSGPVNVSLDAPLTIRDIKNRLQCRMVKLFQVCLWFDGST